MKYSGVISHLCALIISLAAAAVALPNSAAAATPACTSLAADPLYELANNPAIKSVTSTIKTTAAPASIQYCNVTLVYGTNANQNIKIAVGLPLNTTDGGSGGIQGHGMAAPKAWAAAAAREISASMPP